MSGDWDDTCNDEPDAVGEPRDSRPRCEVCGEPFTPRAGDLIDVDPFVCGSCRDRIVRKADGDGALVRVLVTAARAFTDARLATRALLQARGYLGCSYELIHGNARGGDRLAAHIAGSLGLAVNPCGADWDGPCRDTCRPQHRRARRDGSTYCPAAGNYRNQVLVDAGADIGIALLVRNLPCRGTRDCMQRAESAGIPVRRFYQERAPKASGLWL